MPSTKQQAMPSTWNRNVGIDAAGNFLVVSITGQNPPPPAAPPGHTRNDTADDITVFSVDRGGSGAKINYHAKNGMDEDGNLIKVELTGIAMKNGDPVPAHLGVDVSAGGRLMTLTVTKAEGDTDNEDWHFYIQGTADGINKQTQDPRIRNSGA